MNAPTKNELVEVLETLVTSYSVNDEAFEKAMTKAATLVKRQNDRKYAKDHATAVKFEKHLADLKAEYRCPHGRNSWCETCAST